MGMSGFDTARYILPKVWNKMMTKGRTGCPLWGHSLDLKGNKEPDIDLNFSGEYQGEKLMLIWKLSSEREKHFVQEQLVHFQKKSGIWLCIEISGRTRDYKTSL